MTGAPLTLTDDEATPVVTLALSEPDSSKPNTIAESGSGQREHGDGDAEPCVERGGDADGGGEGRHERPIRRLHVVERETLTIAAGQTASTGVVDRDGERQREGRAGQGSDGFGHGERRQRRGGPGRGDPDHRGRRRGADGDPGVVVFVDFGERRRLDGERDSEPSVERGDDGDGDGGVDFYTVGSDATVVIAAGQTANASDSVTVTAVDDAIDNVGDRSVTVTGTAANAQATADSETLTVTGASLDADRR